MEPSDAKLILGYFSGDEKALEILFGRYFKQVYRFAHSYSKNSEDAEDITQKTFLKAWRNLKKFDQSKNFKTWIFSIAKNSAIDFLRKKKEILFSELENTDGENMIAETLADTTLLPTELSEKTEKFYGLALAVGKLPQKYGEIISLRYGADLSFSEIARFLGEKLNTVRSRHRRGILMLKSVFLHQK